ncbi:MAG: hypothetical protein ACRD34_13915 [Bryobacteraceae bacterium]
MTITVSVPDRLAEKAAAKGLSVEAYIEGMAAQAIQEDAAASEEEISRRAVDGLLAFRHKHRLTSGRDRAVGLRTWLHQAHRR